MGERLRNLRMKGSAIQQKIAHQNTFSDQEIQANWLNMAVQQDLVMQASYDQLL